MRRMLFSTLLVAVTLFLAITLSQAEEKETYPVTQATPIRFNPPSAFAGQQEKLLGAAIDSSEEKQQSLLTVTGRRLDAPSAPLQFSGASTAWTHQGYFMTSGFQVLRKIVRKSLGTFMEMIER